MEIITKKMKERYLRRGIVYFLTCNLILNGWLPVVLAAPMPNGDGFTVGTGSITQEGTATNVVVDQVNSIIEWDSLDTATGESLNFSQGQLVNSAVLNRVMSGYGTLFYGDLNAEGMRIFIVNPAGVVFGEGSSINVTQLIASNLDISNENFLAGNYEFAGDIEEVDVYERLGVINNSDDMYASKGVALIGRKILNTGTIETGEGGFVVIAAGDRVLLGQPGTQILVEMNSVKLPEEGDGNVTNDGHISAPAGTVVLAAGDIFASAMELPKVSGGNGRVEQNGHIHADGTSGDGGGISLTAADEVVLSADSLTTANAGSGGDSGLIIAHSKGRTDIEAGAQIEAKGGYEPYNVVDDFDDVVDTSVEIGGDYVNFAGDVDASAMSGKRGKVIIDAMNMTIADGYMPENPPDNTVYEKWIEQQSYASTDVELVAHSKTFGDIIAEPISDGVIEGGSGDIVFRTVYDTGGIEFLPGPGGQRTAIHTTQGGNVYMLAGEKGIAVGDIFSYVPQHASAGWIVEPGKIRLLTTNYGIITTGELSVFGGSYDEVSVIASGNLFINGDVTTYAHQVDEDLTVSQASTCLVSEHGDVEVNGVIKVEAHAKYESTADIHIDAGRDVRIDLGGGQVRATALTSSDGTANASVLIHAGKDPELSGKGNITITNPKSTDRAIYLSAQTQGDKTEIYSDGQAPVDIEVTDVGSHSKLELDENHTDDCPDCPVPPGLDPPLPPMTVPDSATTHMGDPVSANVLDNDSLPQGGELTAHIITEPEHGELVDFDPVTGEYIYQPDEGYVGEDTFTYIATDGELFSETVSVTITITNTLPALGDDTATTHMGDPVNNIDVLANDADPDSDTFTVNSIFYEGDGILIQNEDGTFTYTPPDGFVGEDTFTYTANDGQNGVSSAPATVVISVINGLPTLADDMATTDQDVAVTIDVLGNDFDPDGDPLSVADFTYEGDGILVLNEDGTFSFTPESGFSGQDSFTYSASDPQTGAELEIADVIITVNPAPVVAAVPFITPAPGLERIEFEVSGCPALVHWAANELGIDERVMQVWAVNTLASSRDIQPCDACERLKNVAAILRDDGGTRVAALAQVIGERASTTAPPTQEQMASVADVIARNAQANNHYAAAGEYLDALVAYVGILNNEMSFSNEEAIMFAADKYVVPLAEDQSAGVTAYIAARLADLGGS